MSYKYSILAVTDTDKMFGNLSNVSIANAFRNIGQHFAAVAVGSESVCVSAQGVLGGLVDCTQIAVRLRKVE